MIISEARKLQQNLKKGRYKIMNEKRIKNGIEYQLERISKKSVRNNLIVLDRLEQGALEVYMPIPDELMYIQPTEHFAYVRGADPIAELKIDLNLEEKTVSIQRFIIVEEYEDFEELEEMMLGRFSFFVSEYDLEIISPEFDLEFLELIR
ncbi:MAG: hypothetical protein HDR09_00220 [Lachnospiraceae bacterium]|nr:hypothetical protein [Lachnospiraceae bacterium]